MRLMLVKEANGSKRLINVELITNVWMSPDGDIEIAFVGAITALTLEDRVAAALWKFLSCEAVPVVGEGQA